MPNKVVTFGCRLNIFESAVIEKQIDESDLNEAIIINSCAVTQEAERQFRQTIRKERRNNPNKKIIVTGCAVQISPDKYAEMKEVDFVIGNQEKLQKETYQNLNRDKVIVQDIMKLKEGAAHLVNDFAGKARAYLEIQNGCNHRCTFCIIPFGRGNNRSISVAEIVANCNHIIELGYKEIVFTGVDITDYGRNLPGTPTLAQLIIRVLKLCPKLERLRLSSIDVAEIDDELFELMAQEKRLMPHLHISLQAGDNMILKRMKRRHLREDVYKFVENIRKIRENIGFGADIIAGFPTESDEMFLNSYNLIKDLEIPFLHVFPYSEREGTPAAKIPKTRQVAKNIRKERAKILRDLGSVNLHKFQQKQDGRVANLLIENNKIACTENFIKLPFSGKFNEGEIVQQKIHYNNQTQELRGNLC